MPFERGEQGELVLLAERVEAGDLGVGGDAEGFHDGVVAAGEDKGVACGELLRDGVEDGGEHHRRAAGGVDAAGVGERDVELETAVGLADVRGDADDGEARRHRGILGLARERGSYTPCMSRASALIWVVICVVLGALVWWTTPRASVEVEGPALLSGFAAGDVREIRITHPQGATLSLERGVTEGLWLLRSGAGETRFVVESSRVQGFLRLLAELRSAASADARPMPKAIMVQLVGSGGSLASVAIDPEFLAGRGRVALLSASGTAAKVAVTSEDLAALVRPEAVTEWRAKALLPWAPDRSNAIAIGRADGAGVAVERSGAGWLLTAPLTLRAEASAAQGVPLWLANAAVDRFLEDAPGNAFAKPSRTIVIATDSLERRRIEQRIELGPALDARSSVIRVTGVDAESGRMLWGPVAAVVQTSLLAGVSDDPAAYLTRVCFAFGAADVSAVRFPSGGTTITRAGDGGFGANDASVRALLRLLTEVPAAQVSIIGNESAASEESILVKLIGASDAALGEATLAVDTIAARTEGAPSVPAIRVTVDRVRRVIPVERAREFLASIKAIAAAK